MIDKSNFIKNKWGQKRYACYCDKCGSFKGYPQFYKKKSGRATSNFCLQCTNSGQKVIESKGYCEHCKNSHPLPPVGVSNDHWLWEKNERLIKGGTFWCRAYLKFKAYRYDAAHPEECKLKSTRAAAARRAIQTSKLQKIHSERTAALYSLAKVLEKTDGIKREVHHEVPLKKFEDFVCGLHVPWNMTILTHEEHVAEHRRLSQILTLGKEAPWRS